MATRMKMPSSLSDLKKEATQRKPAGRMAKEEGVSLKPEHYREYYGEPKSVRNETIRANNKRIDQGKPTKVIPTGAAGAKLWKGKPKTTRKRVSK